MASAQKYLKYTEYRFPLYIIDCIDRVKNEVDIKITEMEDLASKCEKCNNCIVEKFEIPEFRNDTCPIPEQEGSTLTQIFNQASNILTSLESDWSNFRDDMLHKYFYLYAKILGPSTRLTNFYKTIERKYKKYSSLFSKTVTIASNLKNYAKSIINSTLKLLKTNIDLFDRYFRDQTDLYIIWIHENSSSFIVNNWDNVPCRQSAISYLFYYLNYFAYAWSDSLGETLDIQNVDGILASAISLIAQYQNNIENCFSLSNATAITDCLLKVSEIVEDKIIDFRHRYERPLTI